MTPEGLIIESHAENLVRVIKSSPPSTEILAKGNQSTLHINDVIELAFNPAQNKGFSPLTLTYSKETQRNIEMISNFLEKINCPNLKEYAAGLEREGFTVETLPFVQYDQLRNDLGWKMAHAHQLTDYFKPKESKPPSDNTQQTTTKPKKPKETKEPAVTPKNKPTTDKPPIKLLESDEKQPLEPQKPSHEKKDHPKNQSTTSTHKTTASNSEPPPAPEQQPPPPRQSKSKAVVDYISSDEDISTDLMTPQIPVVPKKKKSTSKPKKSASSSSYKKPGAQSKTTNKKKKSNDKEYKPEPDLESDEEPARGVSEPRRSTRIRINSTKNERKNRR
jgi:hypothetical protein